MSIHDSALGQATVYPTQYDATLLFPIARAEGRAAFAATAPTFISAGVDVWHVFELSWLDAAGKPVVAIGRMTVPAHSPYLIESKSLKLYFNGLNFAKFADDNALTQRVIHDLSKVADAPVQFELFSVDELVTYSPQGICLDRLDMTTAATPQEPNPLLLKFDSTSSNEAIERISNEATSANIEETLYSNLLRSNCPVTGQSDWGTVFIRYQGQKVCHRSLLTYIISYRQHSGFHEQCVEQIFADIWQVLQPEKLAVHAQYTRRGGLDINPCRSSDPLWLPKVTRLARQ